MIFTQLKTGVKVLIMRMMYTSMAMGLPPAVPQLNAYNVPQTTLEAYRVDIGGAAVTEDFVCANSEV